ncbi:hypothetical protein Tco_1465368 [Tanacetum coccineum]
MTMLMAKAWSYQIIVRSDLLLMMRIGDRPRRQDTTLGVADAQTRPETASKMSYDPPLSEVNTSGRGEDNMEYHYDLTNFVPPTPHDLPLSGEEAKTAQDRVITRLKLRVQRLEKKRKARTPQPMKRRLFKGRVETSSDNDLDEEDASKQGRESDKTKSMFQDSNFDVLDDDMEDVEGETIHTATTGVSVVSAPVTTAGVAISTKEKGVALKDVEDSPRPIRSITTLQPLPTIDPKDKELAQRLHEEELAELDRAQKEIQKQEEATSAALAEEFDEIQAKIDVDHELAVRLTHEEQEKYTIKERARLLVEFFERRKKKLAAERAEAIRNKPHTRTQVRNRIITYLKHMGKYTHQQLKHKNFEEVQKLYEREKKWIDDFKSIDDDSQQQAESTKKRPRADSEEESFKKQKLEEDNDAEKMSLEIVWIADGSSKNYKIFSEILDDFDRQDVIDLQRLPNEEDEIWKNQQDYNLISWRLFDSCGVHVLLMNTRVAIHMMIEKKYPLTREMLSRMLNRRLEVDYESEMAFELLRFTRSQLQK